MKNISITGKCKNTLLNVYLFIFFFCKNYYYYYLFDKLCLIILWPVKILAGGLV